MAEFKRKIYAAAGGAAKGVATGTILGIASLGVSTASLASNLARNQQIAAQSKAQEKASKKQLEAMDRLTNTLGDVDKSMKNFKIPAQSVSNNNNKVDNKKKPKSFFRKFFSIESGSYKGLKRVPSAVSEVKAAKALGTVGGVIGGSVGSGLGVVAGASTGAAFGAFSAWMYNRAEKSLFNSGLSRNANSYNLIQVIENKYSNPETKAVSTTPGVVNISTKKLEGEPKGTIYEVDSNPNKFVISLLYRNNVLLMYINNPSRQELGILNEKLDEYCFTFKNADYSSEQLRKNTYCVEVFVVSGAEENLLTSLIDSGFKLNIITGDKFGIDKN